MVGDRGYSLLEVLIVLGIIGLLATIPIFSRPLSGGPSVADIKNLFREVLTQALQEGESQLVLVSSFSVKYGTRELVWSDQSLRLTAEPHLSDPLPVVIYGNGTSSAYVALATSTGNVSLLSVPKW